MHVGALRIELRIRGARSLKDKRHVVKSIVTDIGRAHPVAAAEVDHQDLWQRSDLGVAVVADGPGQVDRVLAAIRRDVDRRPDVEVLRVDRSTLEREDR